MAGELIRPGVEVIQSFASPSPSFVRPTLVPCIVGTAFEVLNVLTVDGAVNQKALHSTYRQLGSAISESAFPDPRNNIDELDILEDSIRPFMQFGGLLTELPMDPGSAFLAKAHGAGKAAIRTTKFNGLTGLALDGKVLVLSIDNPVVLDTTPDVSITFSGVGNLTASQVASQINDSVGTTVATVVGSAPDDCVQIASPSFGAFGSVTVRRGGSANDVLKIGYSGELNGTITVTNLSANVVGVGTKFTDFLTIGSTVIIATVSYTILTVTDTLIVLTAPYAGVNATGIPISTTPTAMHEERIEGSGWRGQDQLNNTTQTPWIEFFIGAYLLDGVDRATFPTGVDYPQGKIGLMNIETQDSFVSAHHAVVTFGDNTGQLPVKMGDFFFADGIRLAGGEIAKVEAARFKVGTINTALSTADSNGNYTKKVYDIQTVATLFDANPFAPKYAYFRANELNWRVLSPVADSATGTTDGAPATTGWVKSAANIVALPVALAGLRIHYISTIDGVETDGVFTFSGGPFAAVADVANAIGTSIPGVTATADGSKIMLTTLLSGRLQGIVVKSDSTAYDALKFRTTTGDPLVDVNSQNVATAQNSPAKDVEFVDISATLVSGTHVATSALTGTVLEVEVSSDGGLTYPVTKSITFAAEYASATLAAAAMNLVAGFTGPGVLLAGNLTAPDRLTITHVDPLVTGKNSAIRIKASTTTATGTNKLAFVIVDDSTAKFSDRGEEELNGQTLKFTFDQNPHVYDVTFSANSLDLAIEDINAVVGAVVASKVAGSTAELTRLKLTSTLKGVASRAEILSGFAATAFGIATGGSSLGSARPYPDAYMLDAVALHIQSQILRDQVTGYPLDQTTSTGSLFVQYKALRKDVSASAKTAGVVRVSDPATLSAVLDPLTEENPLGLGAFLCMINCPTFEIKLLGIDEITAAAFEGTGPAWLRAASLLESEEVYAIAPLTQDEVVHAMLRTHVQVMSAPEQGGERVVFTNSKNPTRKNSKIALSGTKANSTNTFNQMLLDDNPAPGLLALGINPALPIPETDGVYMEMEVESELRRYSVATVSGPLVSFRTSFSSVDTNVDGFYSTVTLDVPVVNAPYGLDVRGASIAVPGSNPVKLDYGLMAEVVGEANATFKNRRAYSVFPDTIKTVVLGIEKKLPGYYAAACIAGMCAAQPPQQGFTNFPMTGLTGVVGTERFTRKQLNVMAGGGTYILIQDVQGGAVTSRHQLSTDTSSIESREFSITKTVDFVAKILRLAVRKFIGVNVINSQLLDTLGTTVHAVLKFLEDLGVLNGSNLNNVVQDKTTPDTVLIDVTLEVPYPCNYLRLTLVV